ncbi:MAG: DUF4373 domain-containing protein [Bacteroidales bacterium]|nr:DUF4373 domain-containing protein [Bacteroidales bacterium]
MARTSKRGLDYFPMDIDIFSDLKIRKLIKYQGGKAISIYALLLCNIYKNGYYIEWDEELPFICSELTGFDEAYVLEVIKVCLSLGLFSKELFDAERVLTSKGIQERYKRICIQCRRVCNITDYSLLSESQVSRGSSPKIETAKQSTLPRYEPYSLTLDQEIEGLKEDECWLDQLQVLHSMRKELLYNKLDDFRIQCIADGKERGHTSLADAKRHFNSWLRIVSRNKTIKNGSKQHNKKNIGFDVSATSAEDYSDWLQD